MALSNAERQRRFRERRNAKAAIVDNGHADIAAVYEKLRREWLVYDIAECGPAERAYREKLAAMPVGLRSPSERPERIEELFMNFVGDLIGKAYKREFREKWQADRRRDQQQSLDGQISMGIQE